MPKWGGEEEGRKVTEEDVRRIAREQLKRIHEQDERKERASRRSGDERKPPPPTTAGWAGCLWFLLVLSIVAGILACDTKKWVDPLVIPTAQSIPTRVR